MSDPVAKRFQFSRPSVLAALWMSLFIGFSPLALAFENRRVGAPSNAPVFSGSGFKRDCLTVMRPPNKLETYGPYYRFSTDASASGKVDLATIGTTKFSSYNFLNLLQSEGTYETVGGKRVWQYGQLEKPTHQIEGVIRQILHERPMFLTGVEIESIDAMEKLSASGLHDEYFMVLIPGNDRRGINVGTFIHRSIGLDAEVQSYRKLTHQYEGRTVRLMSRDFPVITFRVPGADLSEDPLFIYAGVHLKSQRGSGVDVNSVEKRKEQILGMMEVLRRDYEVPYGGRVPIIIAGDFNADLNVSAEIQPLKEKFMDTLDVVGIPPSDLDGRATYSYFPTSAEGRRLPVDYSQLDGILVSKNTAKKGFVKEAHVVPDRNEDGSFRPLPRYPAERDKNGSDHRMVSMTFDMQARYAEWLANRKVKTRQSKLTN